MKLPRPTTVRAAIDAATRTLRDASPTPAADADVLLRHASGLTRTDVVTQSAHTLPDAMCAEFVALVERRRRGEPVAYLTGRREFWSLDLAVSPATLIPRPETELLVERALARVAPTTAATVLDLGTGCGAIALAIAHERRRARVVALDCSEPALALARANAERLNITNVEFRRGDWFAPVAGRRFDAVVSNPPYVRADDPHLQADDLRFEPRIALTDGGDGLDAIRRIAGTAPGYLVRDGWLLLEHGFDQAGEVRTLMARAGYRRICSYKDMAGHERVTEGQTG